MRVCDFCKAEKPNELRPEFDVELFGKDCTVHVVSPTGYSELDICEACALMILCKLVESRKTK